MLSGKHYLLVLIAAVLLGKQISCAEDLENEKPVNKSQMNVPAAEDEADDPQLAQSPWTLFGNQFGSSIFPIDNPLQQTFGLYFPALYTFAQWAGLNRDLLGAPQLPPGFDANTDVMPAASKVMLVLADDKRTRNVKRSPIFPPELMRQVRQSPDALSQFLTQTFGQVSQGVGQILGQAPNADSSSDLAQSDQFQQLLSQALSQINQLGQNTQQMLGQAHNAAGADDVAQSSDAIIGQAPNTPFNLNGMLSNLGQMFGSSSEISEVRVKPDTEQRAEEQLLLESLNDKKRPILWFRDAQQTTTAADYKKTPEEIALEQKLLAFERQVIRELRLLQQVERQAREMQAATKGMSAKVTKGAEYKVNYPLNEKPMHKITMEDIEKALADEFVRKMLQKQAQMQEPGKPTKRHSQQTKPLTQQEIAQVLAYALRGATGTKETAQSNMQMLAYDARTQEAQPFVSEQKFNDKDMNMEMGDIQSIEQLQRYWMQPQYNAEQMRWANEKLNIQQEENTQDQQNARDNENVANTEEMHEGERIFKGHHKGHKKGKKVTIKKRQRLEKFTLITN